MGKPDDSGTINDYETNQEEKIELDKLKDKP